MYLFILFEQEKDETKWTTLKRKNAYTICFDGDNIDDNIIWKWIHSKVTYEWLPIRTQNLHTSHNLQDSVNHEKKMKAINVYAEWVVLYRAVRMKSNEQN